MWDGFWGSVAQALAIIFAAFIGAGHIGDRISKASTTTEADKESDALVDRIVDAVKARELQEPFGVANVKELPFTKNYAESHVNTVLANYAVGGYYDKRGIRPRFKRAQRGLYRVKRLWFSWMWD